MVHCVSCCFKLNVSVNCEKNNQFFTLRLQHTCLFCIIILLFCCIVDMICDSDDNELDTSWIDEHVKLSDIENNCCVEPHEHIRLFFFYVARTSCDNDDGHNKFVKQMITHKHLFQSDDDDNNNNDDNNKVGCRGAIITKEQLLFIIEKHRMFQNKKHNLSNLLLFSIPTEPMRFLSHENHRVANDLLRTVSIFEDVVIPPAVFVFQPYTSLFFIFEEQIVHPPLKSIIRNVGGGDGVVGNIKKHHKTRNQLNGFGGGGKKTKKLRFAIDC